MNENSPMFQDVFAKNEWEICSQPLEDDTQTCMINSNKKCQHEFHQKWVQDYIREQCKQILGKKVHWPVSEWPCSLTATQAFKIINDATDIVQFECNEYLSNKKFMDRLLLKNPNFSLSDLRSASDKSSEKMTMKKDEDFYTFISRIKKLATEEESESIDKKFNDIIAELKKCFKRCNTCKLPLKKTKFKVVKQVCKCKA